MFQAFSPFRPFDLFRTASSAVAESVAQIFARSAFSAPLTTSLVAETGDDVTITRATAATCWGFAAGAQPGDAQVLLNCASGEARFEGARRVSESVWSDTYADGTPIPDALLKGVVREPLATNLLTYSDDFMNAVWVNSVVANTRTANQAVAPDGSFTATRINFASGDNRFGHGATSTAIGKKLLGIFTLRAAAPVPAELIIVNSGAASTIQPIDITTEWKTYSVSRTVTTSTTYFQVATRGNGSLSANRPAVSGIYLGNAALYDVTGLPEDQYPTSHIPTTSATVTRNKDELLLSAAAINDAQGSLYLEVDPSHYPPISGLYCGDGVEAVLKPIADYLAASFDGTQYALGPAGSPSAPLKLAASWNAATGKQRIAVNGAVGAESDYDGSWNLSSVILGNATNARYRNVRAWDSELSADDLKRITA
jgi:hypothetical protein